MDLEKIIKKATVSRKGYIRTPLQKNLAGYEIGNYSRFYIVKGPYDRLKATLPVAFHHSFNRRKSVRARVAFPTKFQAQIRAYT